jgi:shikimate kinase
MPGHVVLVGLMGSGKTTVGRELAAVLNRPLVDNDEQVLATTGRTVAEISAHDGIAEMRRLEGEALAEALASPVPAVITAAAGVILDDKARRSLRDPFVVWLRAAPETVDVRIRHDPARPLLADDALTVLRAMEEQRRSLYADVADLVIDVDGLTPANVAETIALAIR